MTKKRKINSKKFDQTRSHQKRQNEICKLLVSKLQDLSDIPSIGFTLVMIIYLYNVRFTDLGCIT